MSIANPNRPWIAVVSSNIVRFAYDDPSRELYVEFKGGVRYVYSDVPLDVYTGLMAAQSAGGFLAERVKGKYSYRKL